VRFEVSMSSWSWRCEVEGRRFEVSMSNLRFEVSGLKCEAFCLRLEVFLSKVRGESLTKLEL
jgi:hypothetical protein